MAVSNKFHKMVLTTGNKSEMAVGYATLYGDMVGGYAPLKDVSKLLVYRLARWRNTSTPDIPARIIERPPSAELREDQRDEDSLPPYEILDPILERYIERDQTPAEIIADGFDPQVVLKVTRLVDLNEYKRRQAAPGVKISKRAFGRERRYPITSGYKEE
jgi:NAD+ synthase (glutamine-hydrolysing)